MRVTMRHAAIKQILRSMESVFSCHETIKASSFLEDSKRFMLLTWHMSYRNDFTEGF